MSLPKKLYKTTVTIWSRYDPTDKYELDDLATEAMSGEFYCAGMNSELVVDVEDFPDTEFFGVEGDDEDGHSDDGLPHEDDGPPSSTRSNMDD